MILPDEDLLVRLAAASQTGMVSSVWAEIQPDAVSVIDPSGRAHTFQSINANANRLVRLLRSYGLKAGDAVALLCSNRAEFVEALHASSRGGFRMTPVNWHLTAGEVAYIVNDCEAKALLAEARFPAAEEAARQAPDLIVKVAIDGSIPGFLDYDEALSELAGSNISDPMLGNQMLYTSGTTGRPKGVFRPGPPVAVPFMMTPTFARQRGKHVQMCVGPAYHAAPLAFDVRVALSQGIPLVFRDRWDAEATLATIAKYRVTHMHLVPIMMQRLLALPGDVKARFDLSHVEQILHGAAPCPPEIKQAMIDWFGPIITEYYGGSEGGVIFFIGADDWLKKPGSVGQVPEGSQVRILDDDDRECPIGVPGTIYLGLPEHSHFVYYKDPDKTAANRRGDFFTMGDVGYFDEDGFLFLTGRNAETIISGGVNIYPQEIDNELIGHNSVADCCCIGVPNAEWGEEVKAVIQLKDGYHASAELKEEIFELARKALAGFKIPRSIDFIDELPRSPAGKIQRHKVRAPYWEKRVKQI